MQPRARPCPCCRYETFGPDTLHCPVCRWAPSAGSDLTEARANFAKRPDVLPLAERSRFTRTVDFSELEEGDPHWSFHRVTYLQEPFTGVATEEHPKFTSEYRYAGGYGEGRSVSTFRNGQLMEEFFLHRGEYVGESKRWFENGQLREHRRHEPPRHLRRWTEAGVLIEHSDEATDLHRKWFATGELRAERTKDRTKELCRDGALAYTWVPRTKIEQTIFDGITFDDAVMTSHLDELVVDRAREHHVFAWVHSLLRHRREEGVVVLRRLLAHEHLWARTTAISLAGNARLVELRPELEGLLGDERVPPPQASTEDLGGRSATRSIGLVARNALAKL